MIELFQYREWSIAESYFNAHYPVFMDALSRGHNLIRKKAINDFIPSMEALLGVEAEQPKSEEVRLKYDVNGSLTYPVANYQGKRIALIPVVGPLSKYGDMCSLGMQAYQTLISKANNDSAIDGIVLIMDTPGGAVDGTPEFGITIKQSTKPVGIFGDGMVASAGYWIASQANVIVGNKNNPTQFGSIGVLMALPNYDNVQEAGNYPRITIYRAKQSTEKALVNPYEKPTGEIEKDIISKLSAVADQFFATVKAGRGDKLDTKAEGLFAGRMFDVSEAKKIGMIDHVGTLQTAISKVAELVRAQARANNNTGTNTDANMKFPKLSTLFSGEAWKKVASAFTEDEATLEATEKKVADMEADTAKLRSEKEQIEAKASELTANVTALQAQVSTLEGEKKALETEKTTLTEEKAELQKKLDAAPTGQLTTVISDEERNAKVNADQGASATKSYRSEADEAADKAVSAIYGNPKKQ